MLALGDNHPEKPTSPRVSRKGEAGVDAWHVACTTAKIEAIRGSEQRTVEVKLDELREPVDARR